MGILFLIGRIILGGYFVMAGFNHWVKLNMMSGYAAMKRTPAPKLAVSGTGVMLLLGGLSLLLGAYPQIGTLLLIIFLLGVSPKMHDFWNLTDPMARMGEMVNFTKNMALVGALVMVAAGIPTPWPFSVSF